MLEENISEGNAFIRLMAGISCVAFGTAKIARKPSCKVGQTMIIFGAMKVAEGLYQHCPVVAMMSMEE